MQALRRATPDIVIIILLFVLPLVYFFPQTLGGKTLIPTENLYQYEPYASVREVVNAPERPQNHLVSDLVLQNYQWKSFIRQQIAIGEVPLWNPHQFAGIPFLAAGQASVLYPLSVIYYVMPLTVAYGWFTVINLWLAGVFMYAFGRGLGIGRAGAMLSGVIYQFSGMVLASVVFQMMIGGFPWLPLMLLMIEYIIRRKRVFGRRTSIPWMAVGAGALGMNVLAGHVEITIYCLLISGFYGGARLIHDWMKERDGRLMLTQASWMLTMVILGIGLAAIQFLPLYEFADMNWRAERSDYDTVVTYAHPTRDILQFALPNFYGNPTHHSIFDLFSGEWVENWDNERNQSHIEWGIKNYVEGALYLGILPLIFAVYASIDRAMWMMADDRKITEIFMREPPYRMIFGTLGLLSLTFMFGLPTYRLIYILPGINQLNSPFRWIFGVTVAVAVMAGFGLDALQRRAAETHTRGEVRTGYALIALAILTFIGLVGTYVAFSSLEPTIENVLGSLALARNAFGEGTAHLFYSYQVANVAVFALMLLLAGFVFVWIGRMRMYKGVQRWGVFAIAVVIADLMIASWGFNPASDPLLLDYTPQSVEWMQERYEEDGAFRYTTLDPTGALLNANSTMRFGLDDIRGYDSIIPLTYVDYMREAMPQFQLDFNRVAPISLDASHYDWHPQPDYVQVLDSSLLALLNVRYIVTTPDVLVPFNDWETVCCDEIVTIYENPLAMPRAYIVTLDEMTLPIGDYDYPEGITRFDLPEYTQASIIRDTGREKWLEVTVTEDSWLVYSENYLSGWRGFVRPQGASDDQEFQVDVTAVAGIFQGAQLSLDEIRAYYTDNEIDLSAEAQSALDTGNFRVRLVYSPTSVQIGFFGSAISAIVITLLLGIWLWTIFVGVNTDDSSQTAKVARNSIAPIVLNLFNRSIDFVFAIILYRLLTQEMVGVYNFAIVVFVWFDIFTNFGLDLFLMREVSKSKDRSGFYLFNTSFFRFLLSIIGLGLLGAFLLIWQNVMTPLPQE
ncbi:MAG: oligosaccharide flippase family protein, partial [Chloroflexota bacterium]